MKTLSEKLRMLRLQNSWSQEDVAYELSMSLPGYSKIERGITDITMSRLEQIAKLYKMSVIELLSYGDEIRPEKLKKLIDEKDKEIMKLQRKIIELMDKK